MEKAFELDLQGVQELLKYQGKFAAKVQRTYHSTTKSLQFDGFELGTMIDFWKHFDSFADQEMFLRGEEKNVRVIMLGIRKMQTECA